MKLNRSKKGFTLVELVIVIAVIGILSAVLVPTFSDVVEKAQISSAQSAVGNAITEYLTEWDYTEGNAPAITGATYKKGSTTYYFSVSEGTATIIKNDDGTIAKAFPSSFTDKEMKDDLYNVDENVTFYTNTTSAQKTDTTEEEG